MVCEKEACRIQVLLFCGKRGQKESKRKWLMFDKHPLFPRHSDRYFMDVILDYHLKPKNKTKTK